MEEAFRRKRRALLGQAIRLMQRTSAFPEALPNDVLFLAGETWAPYYDFNVLKTLRDKHGLRLAALCQDFIPAKFPQFFESRSFVSRFHYYAQFLVNDVDLVIAISDSTKADFLDYSRKIGGTSAGIEVITLGADLVAVSQPKPPGRLSGLAPGSFVLSVSKMQMRKNFDLLYRLWHRFAEKNVAVPKLIIVGQRGFGVDDLLWQIENDPTIRDSVWVLHGISDSELAWLYSNCLWTLYPSIYEGWGLPIRESLTYGKYCLASNTSSLPQAGQGLVGHLDPMDFMSWYDAVVQLVKQPELLIQYERRIATAYRLRTWSDSASEVAAALCDLARSVAKADTDSGPKAARISRED